VTDGTAKATLRPRTLEEAIVYENFGLLRSGTLSIGIIIPALLDDAYQGVYDRIRSDSFKKTDFAMDILACVEEWIVPDYIAEGLRWLEARLCPPLTSAKATAVAAAPGA
jgi:putative ATP-dependent endonuclease of the OLD family